MSRRTIALGLLVIALVGGVAFLLARAGFSGIGGDSASGNEVTARTAAPKIAEPSEPRVDGNRIYLTPSQSREAAAESPSLGPVKSLLNVEQPLKFGDYVWDDDGVGKGPLFIRVDLTNQLMSVFRAGEEIGTAVIVYGATENPSPVGEFPIKRKIKDYHSRSYDAPMPYSMFLTDDGVAIHESSVASGRATHGCIGVPPQFAKKLFDSASVGDVTMILPVENRD